MIREVECKNALNLKFCCDDNLFFYLDGYSIQILNKNFIKISTINLSHLSIDLILSEEGTSAIFSYSKARWSILNLITLKKVFEDRETKGFKDWCARQKDCKCQVFSSIQSIVKMN